ncbi:hexamer-binding HEXBP [Paramyrothecium foliicola]|nr:hexamer-binding HEXBP [Paramyrothecium foliicola]
MADWNAPISADAFGASSGAMNKFGEASCTACGETSHSVDTCPNKHVTDGDGAGDDKCYGCGEPGHRRAECPSAGEMACRYCKQPGHLVKDCPDKPPMVCENCGEDDHMKKECQNARKIDRSRFVDISADEAWAKIKVAVSERDVDDAKEAVQEYVKALEGAPTYREIQENLIRDTVELWFIATERPLLGIFTNMDLQGNLRKKYTISYRFSENPSKPREKDGWPQNREELLERLDDAGEVVDSLLPKCLNCDEIGHTSKQCPNERVERAKNNTTCYNCGAEGHRVRDCPEPRVDKFACKNCGKSGHKVADCEEPPNPDNVECRKCGEKGHFAKDCPQGGGRACRNCGQEGHMAKECDQPRNMDTVTCRNCEKTGHFSRDCPEPKDWSKVQCSNCQQFGHTKVRCSQPPAEAAETDDFGNNAGFNDNQGGNADWNGDAVPVEAGGGGGGDWQASQAPDYNDGW